MTSIPRGPSLIASYSAEIWVYVLKLLSKYFIHWSIFLIPYNVLIFNKVKDLKKQNNNNKKSINLTKWRLNGGAEDLHTQLEYSYYTFTRLTIK